MSENGPGFQDRHSNRRLRRANDSDSDFDEVNRVKRICLFSLLVFLLPAGGLCAATPNSADIRSLIACLHVREPLKFCGERVPLEVQEVRERLEKELLLSLWDRPQVILWLKRSGRYLPFIEKALKENGLPDDLKYVAVAESALRPHVGSSKGAVGFWQFMRQTGRKYGLRIDSRIDERRNLAASTNAAARYFKDLRELAGSWTTAVAAFNMGEERLLAEMMEQDTDNYYHLYLPLETQRFIFRILSIKLIMLNPEKYGFKFSKSDYYRPPECDPIQLECFQDTPIRIVAKAANTHFKEIKDLNPEIRGHYIPTGSHVVLVPKGSTDGFKKRYEALLEKYLEARKERVYVVERGDNLSTIAEKFDVPLISLLIWNRIDVNHTIHPGDRLVVYSNNLKPNGESNDVE